MNFDLRTPCPHCPFRTDIPSYLSGPERAKEIVDAIANGTFSCHNTVDHDEWGDGQNIPREEEQFCAGALIMLEKIDRPGQMMRIAERLGFYDRTKLNMDAPVFDDPEEFICAQERVGGEPVR